MNLENQFVAPVETDSDLAYEETLLTPDGHPDKPGILNKLGISFQSRFERLGDVADIEKAISTQSGAVKLTPDGHSDKPRYLKNLGVAFQSRFERLGDVADIEKAISIQGDAVQLTPNGHSDKPRYMNNLGMSFRKRFKRLGDLADIDKAISVQDGAVRLMPDSHPDKPGYLNNLGASFMIRFERLGDVADIHRGVSVMGDAVRLAPEDYPNKHGFLSNLGNSFTTRFGRLGDVADIDKAISIQGDAVQLTPNSHPNKPGYLNDLGVSLEFRFERLGDVTDINKAISVQDSATQLTPDGHPDKPSRLANLGNSFRERFGRLGDLVDIDKAISVQDDAVQLTSDDHPEKPSHLSNLGISFRVRFERLGDLVDIDKAISAQGDAVRLTPDGHPVKPSYLTNLGNSFMTRFLRLGDVADIDKAISVQDDAVQLMPKGHPNKPACLTNLGNSFKSRFGRLGDVTDIGKAISAQDDAVRLTPDGHPDKPTRLMNLGNSFLLRFGRLRDVADIVKAISVQDNAVQLTPNGHPNKPSYLNDLGDSFRSRFECLGDVTDLNKAMLQYSSAAGSSLGPALLRFNAALKWARCAHQIGNSSHLDANRRALDLLPRVAWLGLPMAEQHRELVNIGRVVRDAAAIAIVYGQYDTALEWLEQGRSIVWTQLLHLRTPIDDLRARDLALADRLTHVSKQLELASTRDSGVQPSQQLSLEQIGRNHRQLASEWEILVERARSVPGFEDFLRPKKLSQLGHAARSGPVVVINVHEVQCDALVLLSGLDEVIHIPLDRFSYDRAQQLQISMKELLSGAGVRFRGERATMRVANQVHGAFQSILAELWVCVVKPVLDSLAFSVSRTADPPRIWWCPTGPLTFLPLHAAGLYDTNEPGNKITDFVASSYTPTLTALLDSPRITQPRDFQLLAIIQPSTPGQSSLPNTEKELKYIRHRADGHTLRSVEGVEATVERVIRGMNESSWVHLACHGTQDIAQPTKSALILQDGRLELSKIVRLTLPHAEFAFLSACQTATGDQSLAEEAVHLAAGMLLAGYRGVIATTWSIMDNDAPVVADEVYSRLFRNGQPDHTQAAHALHHAVQRLREQGAPFVSWLPFIHVGF